ncbi:MAG: hypothetical protein PHR66_06815 [Desulfuromonadaceae bacterium]|nr:hypothetical protein [Desulfuromonadaceae bacterium]
MNSKIIIVALQQFMLVCTPLVGQAAALEQFNDAEQLSGIDRELYQDCLKRRDPLRLRNYGIAVARDRVQIRAILRQDDLLQELLTPEAIRQGSILITDVGGK